MDNKLKNYKEKKCSSKETCPILKALNIIGGKWKIPILWKLVKSPLRYNELKRQVKGISNIMLTRSLRDLEEYKLVLRKKYDSIPPHVEYSLTKEAEVLIPALLAIRNWGNSISESNDY